MMRGSIFSSWEIRKAKASMHKCCSNCLYYKHDYKCKIDPDTYIASTTEKTMCKDWCYYERPSKK